MNLAALGAAAFGALALSFLAAPAAQAAADPVLGATACLNTNITPTASDCVGWYEGNLIGGSPDQIHGQAVALSDLLNTTINDGDVTFLDSNDFSGDTIDFTPLLFGTTVIGIHVGAANGGGGIGYSGTAFFVFDAGNTGLDKITFNLQGLSNARLYSTGTCDNTPGCGNGGNGVPEPATWAMMIMGFGGVGAIMRRRRTMTA